MTDLLSPYGGTLVEPPEQPDVLLKTVDETAEQNAEKIVAELTRRGFLGP